MWRATKLPAYLQRHAKTHHRLYRPAKALVFRVDRHRKTSPPPSYLATDRRSVGSWPALSRRPEQEDTTHRVLRHRGREHNLADPSLFSWIPDEPDSVVQQIFVRRRNHHTSDLTGICDRHRMPSNASYPRLSTAQAAEQREFALPRHRACPVSVAPAQSPPMFTGWRWPRRRRRPTVSHPACRRCRPPAVSPEPSSAALRTVAGQRRFFTAVLAAGEHSSPVTAASTPRSAALRPRLRTLFVE